MSNNKIRKASLREIEKTLERKLEAQRAKIQEVFSTDTTGLQPIPYLVKLYEKLDIMEADLQSIKIYLLFDSSSVEVDDKWVDRFGKYL